VITLSSFDCNYISIVKKRNYLISEFEDLEVNGIQWTKDNWAEGCEFFEDHHLEGLAKIQKFDFRKFYVFPWCVRQQTFSFTLFSNIFYYFFDCTSCQEIDVKH
jgi:hypothetical protein